MPNLVLLPQNARFTHIWSLSGWANLGSADSVFFNIHVLQSSDSSKMYSFLLHVISHNITPPHFRSSYLLVSTHFHVLITTYSSVILPTWPNHISLGSLIFSLMFATPALALIPSFLIFSIIFIPIIHLNILIYVISSKFCSPFSVPRAHLHTLEQVWCSNLIYCCFGPNGHPYVSVIKV